MTFYLLFCLDMALYGAAWSAFLYYDLEYGNVPIRGSYGPRVS